MMWNQKFEIHWIWMSWSTWTATIDTSTTAALFIHLDKLHFDDDKFLRNYFVLRTLNVNVSSSFVTSLHQHIINTSLTFHCTSSFTSIIHVVLDCSAHAPAHVPSATHKKEREWIIECSFWFYSAIARHLQHHKLMSSTIQNVLICQSISFINKKKHSNTSTFIRTRKVAPDSIDCGALFNARKLIHLQSERKKKMKYFVKTINNSKRNSCWRVASLMFDGHHFTRQTQQNTFSMSRGWQIETKKLYLYTNQLELIR